MKSIRFALLGVVMLPLAVNAAKGKAVVFVDKFIPNAGCEILDGQIQVLQDRIVGNVTSSRKYEVVDRENLAKVQKELKLVDAGLTEGQSPESNRLKAAGYCVYGKILQYKNYEQDLEVQRRFFGVVELQIRIENIQNGQLLAAPTLKVVEQGRMLTDVRTTQNLPDEVMSRALEKAAKEVVIKLNEIAFPVYIDDADGKYVTGNVSGEQVNMGDLWDVWKIGKKIVDRDTGEWTGRYREKRLCQVKVAIPGPKATKFECLNADDAKTLEELLENDVTMILRRSVLDPVEPEKHRNKGIDRLNALR